MCAGLSPADDYDQWECIFTTLIQDGSGYEEMASQCMELMFQILCDNSLAPPLQDKTGVFLTKTIPNVTHAILKIRKPRSKEVEFITDFLGTVLQVCVWGFRNDNEALSDLILRILDKKCSFYASKSVFESVMDGFVASEHLLTMVARVESGNCSMQQFRVLLGALVNCAKRHKKVVKKEFVKAVAPLGEKLKQTVEDGSVKTEEENLGIVMPLFCELLDVYNDKVNGIEGVFMFVELCVRSSLFVLRKVGVETLTSIAECENCSVHVQLAQFLTSIIRFWKVWRMSLSWLL